MRESRGGPGGIDARRALYRAFATPAAVWSVDGVSADLAGPLDLGVDVGDLLVAVTDTAPHPVVQVESLAVVERTPLDVDLGAVEVSDGTAVTGRGRPVLRSLEGRGSVLGALAADGRFTAGTGRPFHETPLRSTSVDEHRSARDAVCGQSGPLVGSLLAEPDLEMTLRAKGFSRHTFLCGQSGSGKTYTTGVLLEALRLATELPLVVVDPNSDHVHLATALEEMAATPEGSAYDRLRDEVLVVRARGRGGDADLVADPSDLSIPVLGALARLDPVGDLEDYDALARTVGDLPDTFTIAELMAGLRTEGPGGVRVATRLANLGVDVWGIWRREGETSVVASRLLDRRCVVVDSGSLDDPMEQALVSATLFGTLWQRRHERRPRLVVVDEAHNAFPVAPVDPLRSRCTELGVLIAGEGRKFGIHLLVATQRPGKVHPNVVSQCDNLVLLRMNSRDDVAELTSTFSHVPAGLIGRAPNLTLGQVLYAGPISPIPTFARTRRRLSEEGGADLATDWTTRRRGAER